MPAALSACAALRGTQQSLENDLFPALLAQGQRFAGLECPGAFIDIGVPTDYHRAAAVLPAIHTRETRNAIADTIAD